MIKRSNVCPITSRLHSHWNIRDSRHYRNAIHVHQLRHTTTNNFTPTLSTHPVHQPNHTTTSPPKMPVQTIPHASSSKATPTSSTPATRPYYFWKPHQSGGFLGQWYTSPFTDSTGSTYATAEMYMMVQKARLFGDEDVAQLMLSTNDPKEHKAMGRMVKGFKEGVWNARTYLPYPQITVV